MSLAALLDPAQTSQQAFFERLQVWPAECVADGLHLRCRDDLGLFMAAYLDYVITHPFSAMHRDFFQRHKPAWTDRTAKILSADAAPRGFAKSTVNSFASVVHDVVYGIEAFIPIISTTAQLADKLVEDLYQVFTSPESYPALHSDFGPFKVKGSKTDFVTFVPGLDPRGCRIGSYSFSGTIRGEKHRGTRPTRIIIDDGEHPERVRTHGQRLKTWTFLTKDILPAGAHYTRVDVVGTHLHPEGMLPTICRSPGWHSKIWKAVITWPDRQDLWDECRRLWSDLHDAARDVNARRFYERHRVAMDRGAEVLWPEYRPLYYLMTELWTLGSAAFSSEYQNEATDPSQLIFDPDRFARFEWLGDSLVPIDSKGRRTTDPIPLSSCRIAVWLDPARSAARHSDYSCIATVAEDPTGIRYLLGCDLYRLPPDQQRQKMWDKYDRYPQAVFGYENNRVRQLFGDQGFLREMNERKSRGLSYKMKVVGYHSQSKKEERIADLQPHTINGWLRVGEIDDETRKQFRDFPGGENDDAPDAVERACWLLGAGVIPTVTRGTPW
jgi:hypothetical protein